MTRILASLAAVAVLAGPVAAFAQGAAAPAAPAAAAPAAVPAIAQAGNLVDTLKAAGQYSTFLKAMDASNLTGVLTSAGPITVLAPTDAAFAALPAGQLDNLMKVENAAQLQQFLLPHLINAAVPPAKVNGAKGPIQNVANQPLMFDGTGQTLTINSAKVIAEGPATNGFIYGVDSVLGAAPAAAPAAAAPAH